MTRDEHLYTIAAEECAELAQRCSKALRFGADQIQPGQDLNNRQRILWEFSHLVAALEQLGLLANGLEPLRPWIEAKKIKVERFLEYSRKLCGTVEA